MRALRRFFKRLSSWATTQPGRRAIAEGDRRASRAADRPRICAPGLSPAEARRQAVLKFGAVEAMKESYREQRGLPFLETLIAGCALCAAAFAKGPGVHHHTVLTLALGIGATTSIFTLVHAVLASRCRWRIPSELYRLGKEARCCYMGGYSQDKEFSLVSYDLYKYFRDNTKGFAELAAFSAIEPLFGVRRAGQLGASPELSGRVRLRQLLRHVRHRSVCGTHAHRW